MAEFMMIDQRRRKHYKPRRDTCEHSYKDLYRFKKDNVQWLAQHFLQETHEKRGGALDNEEKMRIFLRYVGDPGFQTGVAEDIGVSQGTISLTFWEVAAAIKAKAANWIQFPTTVEELQNAKIKWQECFSFPDAIGAVDCTHILIKKPSEHGDEYINRKGVATLNVQATCNAKEEFTSVDISWPGSVHDSRIWRNSDICRIMTNNHANALLLGDVGYAIAPWLLTPYQNPTTPEQRAYNKCITKERVIIERCFGQLKQRFPILQNKIRVATDKVPLVILCCVVLHNVAKHLLDEDYEVPLLQDDDEEDRIAVREQGVRVTQRGQQRRDAVARMIHNVQL